MYGPLPNPVDTNNNCVRHYNNVCQSSFSEDFNNNNPLLYTPVNLQTQSYAQNFFTSDFSLSDNVSITTNTTDYRNTGNYTGDYSSCLSEHAYQGVDTTNGQLNLPSHTHTNSPFQAFCGSSDQYYPDTTNNDLTDNLQDPDMINSSSTGTSYIFTQESTGSGYNITKVEYTQTVFEKLKLAEKEFLRVSEQNVRLEQELQRSQRSARQNAELVVETQGLLKKIEQKHEESIREFEERLEKITGQVQASCIKKQEESEDLQQMNKRLDEELSTLRTQLAERTKQLNEAQKQLLSRKPRPIVIVKRLEEQEKVLKEEIRRMDRMEKRQDMSIEYLKNVVLKFLESSAGEREYLVPAITTILQLSPEETKSL
ncbi:4938_t:CDS:2 [Paraglomus brasilianum]|uniref:4938_t:CDS:1 n=1 Tax=Paraglomus brasilianum TaxID=144538 RepID=A0A9N9CGU1_9GLOM|nr:4938_t:CDS:2 [Paraglomus brasilianum]